MTSEHARDGTKSNYVAPKILATYDRQALEESIQPHGQAPGECTGGLCGDENGGGCGCGCGTGGLIAG
jgi:hypothetical protein